MLVKMEGMVVVAVVVEGQVGASKVVAAEAAAHDSSPVLELGS